MLVMAALTRRFFSALEVAHGCICDPEIRKEARSISSH